MSAANVVKKAGKPQKPRVYLRVIEGGLVPVDLFAYSQLRENNYQIGDVLAAELKKPNDPDLHRLLFRIACLCIAHIAAFHGMSAHQVLKRLQWEANIACEELGVMVPGVGYAMMRFPLSLSFESMGEAERREVARAMCRHISEKYWPALAQEQIEQMAGHWMAEV